MEIIAETNEGYLIKGSFEEIKEILRAVMGEVPKNISIGHKIPAIDYAQTIKNVQKLSEDYDFKQMFKNLAEFVDSAEKLKKVVDNAKNIEFKQ